MLSEKVFKSGYDVTSKSKLAGSEKNDCFVRACSNAFNVSYELAHEFVAERFDRKNGKGTKRCNTTLKELQNEVLEFQPEGQLSLFSDNGGKQIKLKHIGCIASASAVKYTTHWFYNVCHRNHIKQQRFYIVCQRNKQKTNITFAIAITENTLM